MKTIIRKFLNYFGYEVFSGELSRKSDDPFELVSGILNVQNIKYIIDGGASIGDTSLRLSELFPDAQVFAFEPYPVFIEILEMNTKNNPRIQVVPFALDEVEGKRKMIVNESEGTNSFFPGKDSENQPYANLMKKKAEIEVKCKSLDDWSKTNQLSSIDLIKLDLQGNELAALRGATQHLKSNKVKAILAEVSFIPQYEEQPIASEVMNMLTSYDFTLFNFYQMHYHHGQLIQADALFLHRSIYEETIRTRKALFLPHSKFLRQ